MAISIHFAEDVFGPVGIDGERDPESVCRVFEIGPADRQADCETDGHYLCKECVHSIHRTDGHTCRWPSDCPGPGKPEETEGP